MGKFGFGELEFSILKIVRKLGHTTVREAHENLGSEGRYTTIMTVMSRLAEKGELIRNKEGKQYVYWASPSTETSSKGVLSRIKDKIFGGKGAAMVSYLLESDQTISNQELDEIERLIQKRKLESKKNG